MGVRTSEPGPAARAGKSEPKSRSPRATRRSASAGTTKPTAAEGRQPVAEQVRAALSALRRKSTKRNRDGLARYGLPSDKALGVAMSDIQAIAKRLGGNHDLAAALWNTDVYEARLLASLAGHDKTSGDEPFAACLPLIERAATDERNFVKKGVSWALRRIGTRSPKLKVAALQLARKLAASPDSASKWVGKDALRDLTR